MSAWSEVDDTECPVARAQSVVGERWTVLVIRELFMGNSRFDDIQIQTGATPQMLAARLKKLEAAGLIERRPYSTRPLRHEYVLTEMGMDFYPVILALRAWGEKWCKPRKKGVAVRYIHIPCGKDPGLGTVCRSCGLELKRADLVSKITPDYAREREGRAAQAKSA
ncbi:helix-turn-helix transcriptional regulator [Paraburkholderia sp. LEh10]|uniref:winged helix-turn-helix transcriptional regulator n=1 Tax=Paraburkholderia sp. LEh10 TaxID=2821353 RepID=UPI001AE25946|nr:helix-turn-helix domain-containing protein [Paraburkholderia sp. LEh10]MBP0590711.1 helix-turn-helix transcriptional regulator [Paraburkholderia sp. LEh10]